MPQRAAPVSPGSGWGFPRPFGPHASETVEKAPGAPRRGARSARPARLTSQAPRNGPPGLRACPVRSRVPTRPIDGFRRERFQPHTTHIHRRLWSVMSYPCDNRMVNPTNTDPTYHSNHATPSRSTQGAHSAVRMREELSAQTEASPGSPSSASSRWSPYGLCSRPPARHRTAPPSTESARDRFIPCRAPLDSYLSNYLLAASDTEQDYESTPSKQDYMNTLKESVLHSHGDAKVPQFAAPRHLLPVARATLTLTLMDHHPDRRRAPTNFAIALIHPLHSS